MTWLWMVWMMWMGAALAQDPAGLQPVEIRPGATYTAGTRVQGAEFGLSFEIPAGWKGGQVPGADVMMLASDVHPGMVLITGQREASLQDVLAIFSQAFPLDATLALQPQGAPTTHAKDRVRQRYSGVQPGTGALVGVAEAKLSDQGGGIAFIAVGPETERPRYEALVETLIGSVQTIARPNPANPTPPTGPLAQVLAGNQLYYLKVEGGLSDESRIDLCRDGTVVQRTNASGMSTGGAGTLTYAQQGGKRGAWGVSGDTVLITWEDGKTGSWPIEFSGAQLTVWTENWWVKPGGC